MHLNHNSSTCLPNSEGWQSITARVGKWLLRWNVNNNYRVSSPEACGTDSVTLKDPQNNRSQSLLLITCFQHMAAHVSFHCKLIIRTKVEKTQNTIHGTAKCQEIALQYCLLCHRFKDESKMTIFQFFTTSDKEWRNGEDDTSVNSSQSNVWTAIIGH